MMHHHVASPCGSLQGGMANGLVVMVAAMLPFYRQKGGVTFLLAFQLVTYMEIVN
jgi:hypothetical protein